MEHNHAYVISVIDKDVFDDEDIDWIEYAYCATYAEVLKELVGMSERTLLGCYIEVSLTDKR